MSRRVLGIAPGFPPSFTDGLFEPRVKLLHKFPGVPNEAFYFPDTVEWCLSHCCFYHLFVFERRTHAESNSDAPLKRKVSKDIMQKVDAGKGGDFVRVIIQPASQSDAFN